MNYKEIVNNAWNEWLKQEEYVRRTGDTTYRDVTKEEMDLFVRTLLIIEREECAELCDKYNSPNAAKAIRARRNDTD
jgi:hypothetical protein